MHREHWSTPRYLRNQFRKPFGDFRIFVGQAPICASCEKENLDSEPKREEKNVRQDDPAPSRRNLLKHLSDRAETEQNASDHSSPQPAQRLRLDRRLKKLWCQRLRRQRHGYSLRLKQDFITILMQKTKVERACLRGFAPHRRPQIKVGTSLAAIKMPV
jgi:uncharacterized Zn finger protein (UPF0148 family)